jgi:hypothetical protein
VIDSGCQLKLVDGAVSFLRPVKNGTVLRFYLRSGDSCLRFKDAIDNTLKSVEFSDNEVEEDEAEPLSAN